MVVGSGAGLRFGFLLVCTKGGDGGAGAVCFSTREKVPFCVRLWVAAFSVALFPANAFLAAEIEAIEPEISQKRPVEKQFRSVKIKYPHYIYHLEQNQKNLTGEKKSPRCER